MGPLSLYSELPSFMIGKLYVVVPSVSWIELCTGHGAEAPYSSVGYPLVNSIRVMVEFCGSVQVLARVSTHCVPFASVVELLPDGFNWKRNGTVQL